MPGLLGNVPNYGLLDRLARTMSHTGQYRNRIPAAAQAWKAQNDEINRQNNLIAAHSQLPDARVISAPPVNALMKQPTAFDQAMARWTGPDEGANVTNALTDVLGAQFAGGGLAAGKAASAGNLGEFFDPRLPMSKVHALYGMKRWPALYHGTKGDVNDILSKGFVQGQSAELNLPGTSLSRDPSVSMTFAANNEPSNMLRVTPTLPPSDVRNLRPSEYLTGVTGDKAYNKPNSLLFDEAETFFPRRGEGVAEADEAVDSLVAELQAINSKRQGLKSAVKDGMLTSADYLKADAQLSGQSTRLLEQLKAAEAASPASSMPVDVRPLSSQEARYAGWDFTDAQSAIGQVNAALDHGGDVAYASLAESIKRTRGNRGAFDKVMRRIVNNASGSNRKGWHVTPPDETVSGKWMVKSNDYASKGEHFDTEDEAMAVLTDKINASGFSLGAGSERAVKANKAFQPLQEVIRGTRSKDPSELFIPQRGGASMRERLDPINNARNALGKPPLTADAAKSFTVQDARDTIDEVQRLWVKERNALADRIEQQHGALGVTPTQFKLSAMRSEGRLPRRSLDAKPQ